MSFDAAERMMDVGVYVGDPESVDDFLLNEFADE